jgi:hypothetical protein
MWGLPGFTEVAGYAARILPAHPDDADHAQVSTNPGALHWSFH